MISGAGVSALSAQLAGEAALLWIDDVMVTGLAAARAGVQRLALNQHFTVYTDHMECCAAAADHGEVRKKLNANNFIECQQKALLHDTLLL